MHAGHQVDTSEDAFTKEQVGSVRNPVCSLEGDEQHVVIRVLFENSKKG